MASGQEIIQYIRDVAKKFDLNRHISFNSPLQEAVWDEESGKWKLKGRLHQASFHRCFLLMIWCSSEGRQCHRR